MFLQFSVFPQINRQGKHSTLAMSASKHSSCNGLVLLHLFGRLEIECKEMDIVQWKCLDFWPNLVKWSIVGFIAFLTPGDIADQDSK